MNTDQTQRLQDRLDITDTIYRYASCIDRRDLEGLRAVLHDDIRARYGNADWIEGGDQLVEWIDGMTRDALWQHHLLSVYHVDFDPDDPDRARVLVYHTSHQVFSAQPDTVGVLVARYHDEVVRTPDGWRISELVFDLCWGEQRTDPTGYLESVGGRGPVMEETVR
jgi:3-phenylpropionate/cinnamic acid dioxygenase small subunit